MPELHKDPIINFNLALNECLAQEGCRFRLVGRTPSSPYSDQFVLELTGGHVPLVDGDGYSVVQCALVRIVLPETFPSVQPAIFVPRAFHPNVSLDNGGFLCWKLAHGWCPGISCAEILQAVFNILTGRAYNAADPDPWEDDRLSMKASALFLKMHRQGQLPFGGAR
jgi:hypothetical protein